MISTLPSVVAHTDTTNRGHRHCHRHRAHNDFKLKLYKMQSNRRKRNEILISLTHTHSSHGKMVSFCSIHKICIEYFVARTCILDREVISHAAHQTSTTWKIFKLKYTSSLVCVSTVDDDARAGVMAHFAITLLVVARCSWLLLLLLLPLSDRTSRLAWVHRKTIYFVLLYVVNARAAQFHPLGQRAVATAFAWHDSLYAQKCWHIYKRTADGDFLAKQNFYFPHRDSVLFFWFAFSLPFSFQSHLYIYNNIVDENRIDVICCCCYSVFDDLQQIIWFAFIQV